MIRTQVKMKTMKTEKQIKEESKILLKKLVKGGFGEDFKKAFNKIEKSYPDHYDYVLTDYYLLALKRRQIENRYLANVYRKGCRIRKQKEKLECRTVPDSVFVKPTNSVIT